MHPHRSSPQHSAHACCSMPPSSNRSEPNMTSNLQSLLDHFGEDNVAHAIDLLEASGFLQVNRSGPDVTIQASNKLMSHVSAAGITPANIDQHVRQALRP